MDKSPLSPTTSTGSRVLKASCCCWIRFLLLRWPPHHREHTVIHKYNLDSSLINAAAIVQTCHSYCTPDLFLKATFHFGMINYNFLFYGNNQKSAKLLICNLKKDLYNIKIVMNCLVSCQDYSRRGFKSHDFLL